MILGSPQQCRAVLERFEALPPLPSVVLLVVVVEEERKLGGSVVVAE